MEGVFGQRFHERLLAHWGSPAAVTREAWHSGPFVAIRRKITAPQGSSDDIPPVLAILDVPYRGFVDAKIRRQLPSGLATLSRSAASIAVAAMRARIHTRSQF